MHPSVIAFYVMAGVAFAVFVGAFISILTRNPARWIDPALSFGMAAVMVMFLVGIVLAVAVE